MWSRQIQEHVMQRIFLYFLLIGFMPCAHAQGDGENFASFAGISLRKTNLSQIVEKFGPAKLVETGDAGEYEAKICYRTPMGLIYFLSGEMGGPEHELLGFGISEDDVSKPCGIFPEHQLPPELSIAGLRLGLSKTEFARILATKVQWEGNSGQVFFESKRPMTAKELKSFPADHKAAILAGQAQNYFDVSISVFGKFSNNKLTAFQVWKIETF
jgi:hypothetical protein